MLTVTNLLEDDEDIEIVAYRINGLVVISINAERQCAVRIVMPSDGDPSGRVTAEVAQTWRQQPTKILRRSSCTQRPTCRPELTTTCRRGIACTSQLQRRSRYL